MLAHCNQCNTSQEIKLDPRTLKPVCDSCKKEVTNLTNFMINAMKDRRDFFEKKKQGFSFHCKNCKEVQQGILVADKKYVKCATCGKKMDVTPHMLSTLMIIHKTGKNE